MTTATPLARYGAFEALASRAAPLPPSYTTNRDTTHISPKPFPDQLVEAAARADELSRDEIARLLMKAAIRLRIIRDTGIKLEHISSSLAQVFDEFGHGIILRGTPVSIDKKNRHPYLTEEQAYTLLRDALDEYDRALQQMPARIVIHKSSPDQLGASATLRPRDRWGLGGAY